FTPIESLDVKPPRVAESPIQIECRVEEGIKLGKENGAGNLVVCRVLKMHINKEVLDENEVINPFKLDVVSRLGGNYYGRAKEGLFDVTKTTTNLGIGVDALPDSIRNSSVLTGNDLGKLGNIEQFPESEIIEGYLADKHELQELFKTNDVEGLHRYAQDLLQDDEVEAA